MNLVGDEQWGGVLGGQARTHMGRSHWQLTVAWWPWDAARVTGPSPIFSSAFGTAQELLFSFLFYRLTVLSFKSTPCVPPLRWVGELASTLFINYPFSPEPYVPLTCLSLSHYYYFS